MFKPVKPSRPVVVAVAAALSLAALGLAKPSAALDIGVSINVAPPVLPVYEQPPIPEPGYIWTPGYWAWSDDGYYWVPGTWVEPPEEGLLWTPGYWGWDNGAYLWHGGYWGPTIGFYGGVNYGYGYFGHGYEGGYWDHGAFRYNRAYNHFGNDVHITNVYNRTVVNNVGNHVSFNGGRGGIQTRADARELSAEHEHHIEPISAQTHQRELAHDNPALRAAENHGHPGIAATSRPGDFQNHVIPARGASHQAAQPGGGAPRPNEQHFNNTPQPGNHAPVSPQHEEHAAPQAQYHAPAPPQQHEQHVAPQAQFHAPAPPPQRQEHMAPQTQYHATAPPQQHEEHVAPQAQFHAPAPQPQFHAPASQPQHQEQPHVEHGGPQEHGGGQRGDDHH
ncbi:MAG TPA: hypothetical protein VHZ99_11500 [Steroidobacteraceae bacterium]|jgi:hypothetical protein|nr:hypothetical protein [Steroidobacteraceae bacterium]